MNISFTNRIFFGKKIKIFLLLLGLMFMLAIGVCKVAGAKETVNLFPNPSFEETKEPNQFGHYFKFWQGWVYDKPAQLALGTIARTGNSSYEMVADQGGKIRLLSPKMKLEPGRYKVIFYLRGLSVGQGQWGQPMDFSVGFDGKYLVLNKSGTFGWTPVSYVFDIMKPVDSFFLSVGLLAGGWLWIDDVSLTKVDDSLELSKEPIVGNEERVIALPEILPKNSLHCPLCGYSNNLEWQQCSTCGHPLILEAKKNSPAVKVIANFEDAKHGGFTGGTLVATEKGFALTTNSTLTLSEPQDWSGYDYFKVDILNPNDSPSSLHIEIQDAQTKDYWTRVNYETIVPPGKSTITLPTNLYVGEKSRPGRQLLLDRITKLHFNTMKIEMLFDTFRLERLNTDSVQFEGLIAFDFGPLDSPVMPGFQQATMAMLYEPSRGFGWVKAKLWKAFNGLQPDFLFQDFICPLSGSFRVDLPDGRYHVIMNIDSPGGYWGEVQAYTKRKVVANGTTVVDENMDIEGFKRKYFRNAHREDLPGIATFNEYAEKIFNIKEFDVDVRYGRLELEFHGEGFAISLSSLVIYPTQKAVQGKKFWDWATEQRRAQFNDYFKQIIPKRTGAAAPLNNYTIFSRSFMQQVNAFDGPTEDEKLSTDGLSVSLAQGEEMPLTFSIQPSGDLGTIELEISKLAYAGSHKEPVPSLPSSVLNPGWLDYRITRVTNEGSVYTVGPRYWHNGPVQSAAGITRRFWLRTKAPVGTKHGPYKGTIVVKPEKAIPQAIPVTLNILPFKLEPITDLAVGPFGSGMRLPWLHNNTSVVEWQWQMFEKALDAQKEAGANSFSGVPHLNFKAENGKIELDTSQADKEMALIRSKGFTHMISSYGAGIQGYQMYGNNNGPDEAAAKKYGFSGADSFLEALYKAVDEHAVANNWLPVAWNLCDEPLGVATKGAAANALAHRKAAKGLKLTTFMGETSMTGKDTKDPHYDLVKALLMPSLNNHDKDSLEVVQEADNALSFYNSASRWTYGRYMKMLQNKHNLSLRLSWHYNVVAGDPYYALDCREDDYAWYNTDASGTMVPSVWFLGQILPGLNDYRYLNTLEKLLKEKKTNPAAAEARKVFDEMMALEPGKDRQGPADPKQFEIDRKKVIESIMSFDDTTSGVR